MTSETTDYGPILKGSGDSDYERYIRTDELLSLQKTADERAHHDELLFQTVHQSSELWLKHACFEVESATRLIEAGEPARANRLLRRAVLGLRLITGQLDMLEMMSPWEYQEVRRVLGHGSGFDSPGVNQTKVVSPALGVAFHALLARKGLTVEDLYRRSHEFDHLYQTAELLLDWDERMSLWRSHHFKIVERSIGSHVVGTQGTPVELLSHLHENQLFPELWDVRTTLTEAARLDD